MRLNGNNGELLAGDVTIPNPTRTEVVARVIDNENASETIYLDQARQGQTCIRAKSYFVLAPTNMTEGFTLTLVNEEGKTAAIRKAGPVDFSRNVVNTITITEATFDGEECGTVTSDGLFTVTIWIVFMNGRNWCPAANMTWDAISQRILILEMISALRRSSNERTSVYRSYHWQR